MKIIGGNNWQRDENPVFLARAENKSHNKLSRIDLIYVKVVKE